ncbi:MAG: gliding motility protein GldL [Prevotellaceae bacterium]|jgi:gliding motility-associated protein GldL|nr:gliding motility protein GldL [Prevotellaceae bacterium]
MANFTETVSWKKFMAKLYGLGAAIVIVGALFKLQHWPGAGIMLTIGMSVEAVIFIFSAFEPLPHPDPHWEIVYPELASGFPAGYKAGHDGNAHGGSAKKSAPAVQQAVVTDGSSSVLAAVGGIDLSGVDTKGLAAGLNKLSETTSKLSDLSTAVASANVLAEKMQQASTSVANLTQSYDSSSQVLSESMNILSDSYQGAAKSISESGKQVGENVNKTGKQMVDVISAASESFATTFALIDQEVKSNLDSIKSNGGSYDKQVEALNKNMTALNTVYELQVQEASKYHKNNTQMGEQLTKLVEDLQRSAEENQTFRKGIAHLNESIAELNNIYGNMLSAVQTATKKRA